MRVQSYLAMNVNTKQVLLLVWYCIFKANMKASDILVTNVNFRHLLLLNLKGTSKLSMKVSDILATNVVNRPHQRMVYENT